MVPEPKIIGHKPQFPNTLLGLFKKGCWEIPEVMGASAVGLLGIALGFIALERYRQMDGENAEFKSIYTIVRNGDPRACRFKNPSVTDYKC